MRAVIDCSMDDSWGLAPAGVLEGMHTCGADDHVIVLHLSRLRAAQPAVCALTQWQQLRALQLGLDTSGTAEDEGRVLHSAVAQLTQLTSLSLSMSGNGDSFMHTSDAVAGCVSGRSQLRA